MGNPVRYTLGPVKVFAAADTGRPYDVLYAEVDSPDAHRLRDRLKELPHTEQYSAYRPHVTLAYLKPGAGAKYAARFGNLGLSGQADALTFSTAAREHAAVPLTAGPRPDHAALVLAAVRPVLAALGAQPHHLPDEPAVRGWLAGRPVAKAFDAGKHPHDAKGRWARIARRGKRARVLARKVARAAHHAALHVAYHAAAAGIDPGLVLDDAHEMGALTYHRHNWLTDHLGVGAQSAAKLASHILAHAYVKAKHALRATVTKALGDDAMNTLDGSAGGFLVPDAPPGRRRKRRPLKAVLDAACADTLAKLRARAGGPVAKAFDAQKHPRGNPKNPGEFAKKGEGGGGGARTKEKPGETPAAKGPPDEGGPATDYAANGTRAKAFKAWFGDWENDPAGASKVVKEDGTPAETSHVTGDGKPLTVYHGTPNKFHQFELSEAGSTTDSGFLGTGFYFTTDPAVADYYSKRRASRQPTVIPAYLSVKNPFRWGKKTHGVRGLVLRGDPLPAAIHDEVIRRTGFKFDPDAEPDFGVEPVLSRAVRDVLAEMGHDGVVSDIPAGKFNPASQEWVAFHPAQIKSVDNAGTFDPHDHDIRKALPAAPQPGPHHSGIFTDSAGRRYRVEDGRRVPVGPADQSTGRGSAAAEPAPGKGVPPPSAETFRAAGMTPQQAGEFLDRPEQIADAAAQAGAKPEAVTAALEAVAGESAESAGKPAAPAAPHAQVRAAMDSLGLPHAHLTDEQLHAALASLTAPAGKPAAAPRKPRPAAKPAPAPAPAGEHLDAAERELTAAVERGKDEPAGSTARADAIVAGLKERHSPEEIRELARRVTGKPGRTADDALHRIWADLTAVERIIDSQRV